MLVHLMLPGVFISDPRLSLVEFVLILRNFGVNVSLKFSLLGGTLILFAEFDLKSL